MRFFPNQTSRAWIILFLVALTFASSAAEKKNKEKAEEQPDLNVAKPDLHPYADTKGGREKYRLAGETVNEARLYDFYQRQADYYMAASPGDVPEILPAYPGLDGGEYGHWGKYSQNNHEDGRWNDIEIGEVLTQVFKVEDVYDLHLTSNELPDTGQRLVILALSEEKLHIRIFDSSGKMVIDKSEAELVSGSS